MGQLGATLGGAVIGAVVGSAIPGVGTVLGAQIGAALGGAVYAILNPPKVTGPRLTDLKTQSAEYGGGIVWGRGTFRTAGTVIWQTDLQEHESGGGGKGGGGGQKSYSYSASFVVLICEGPIQGIRRIWADNKVIWQGGADFGDLPFKVYLGDSTQDPSPTMEADPDLGAGNVPDHRGYALLEVTDWDLKDFFNRIPNIEFEVEVTGGATLERVSTFTATGGTFTGVGSIGLMPARLSGNEVVQYVFGVDGSDFLTYYEKRWNLKTGEVVETVPTVTTVEVDTVALYPSMSGPIAHIYTGSSNYWIVAGSLVGPIVAPPDVQPSANSVRGRPWVADDAVYAISGQVSFGMGVPDVALVTKWLLTGDTPALTAESESYDLNSTTVLSEVNPAFPAMTMSDDGFLYVVNIVDTNECEMWKIDPSDMSLVRKWDSIAGGVGGVGDFLERSTVNATFTVFRNYLLIGDNSTSTELAKLYRMNDDDTFTLLDSEEFQPNDSFNSFLSLGGGYILTTNGILRIASLDTVGAACAAISEYGHDSNALYDVSDLPEYLRGIRIGSPMTKANLIDVLRNGYFFGYAEVDGEALFRHTYHASDATIPEEDVAAFQEGSEPPAKIRWTDTPDDEVPWRIIVKFFDANADFQQNTAIADRDTGASRVETTLDLPLVLTYWEAKQIADAHLARVELERRQGKFTTSRKWLKIAPLDVVTIGDETVRIIDTAWGLGEPVEFTCTPTIAAAYSITVGSAGGGAPVGGAGGGGTAIKRLAQTESVLLDIPVVDGTAPPYGFAWAAGPKTSDRWPGAVLYKSYDGGTNYVEVARKTVPDIIGRTSDALGDYTDPLTDPDETNTVTVQLTRADAELVTVTDDALDGGANRWAIQAGSNWEILQSRDADLASARIYDLSYHLRGQLDTDGAIGDHAAGDTFVALPVDVVDAPESDLNVAIWYQAVTIGAALSPTGWVQFTNTGNNTNSQGGGVVRHLPVLFKFHDDDYTFVEEDRGYWHIFEGSSTITVTMPAGLKDGWNAVVVNIGANDVTLDPANNLDGDSASVALEQFQGVMLATDGTDYYTVRGKSAGTGGGGSSITVKEQGSTLTTALTSLDFLGASITAAHLGGGAVSVTVVQTIHTLDGGVTVDADADTINANAPISMSDAGGGVTNLTLDTAGVTNSYLANMNAHTFKARKTNSTGAPEDATATEATALLDAMVGDSGSGGTKGLVPAPGSGDAAAGKFLKADGAWTVVTGFIPTSAFVSQWGGGALGAITFDGSSAVTGFSRSGSTYTATAPCGATNATIDAGVTVLMNGHTMNCTGTLTVNGTLRSNNGDSTGITAGSATAAQMTGTCGAGSNGLVTKPSSPSAVTNAIGGAGGAGGTSVALGAGNAGAAATAPSAALGGLVACYSLFAVQTGRLYGSTTQFNGGAGGCGGPGNNGVGAGGGGGAGGMVMAIYAKVIAGSGTITVQGGTGGPAPGTNAAGGGGGGGGVLLVITTTANWQSIVTATAAGGVGGAGNGTGTAGANGSDGRIIDIILPG